jgi:hypothetical protein
MRDRYRDWVRTTMARPTEEQIRGFAAWLSTHHSWYKHLPLMGAGEPFIIYLAPHVHQIRVERDDGPGAWRNIVDDPDSTWFGDRLRIDLRDGDREPDLMGSVTQAAGGLSTEQVWTRLSRLSYWNFGRPGQPAADVVGAARARLRVDDDDGHPVAISEPVLWRGLVYLRGTVAPMLGPVEDEYDALQREHDLPSHQEDRTAQLATISAAAADVVAWVYDEREN